MTKHVPITAGTPEEIAFRLMELAAAREGLYLSPEDGRGNPAKIASMEWITRTYQACLALVLRRPAPHTASDASPPC